MLIRYYGSCGNTSGYAHAANELALALLGAGAQLEIRILGPEGQERFEGDLLPLAGCVRSDDQLTPDPDVALFHTLPHSASVLLAELEKHSRVAKRRVVYTTWEATSMISDEVCGWLRPFDEIWVPSHANRTSMRPFFEDDGIKVVPHAFGEDSLEERRISTIRIGQADPQKFRFYSIGAWTGRKNPAGLLRAWAMAFQPDDPVRLHIHSADATQDQFLIAACSTGLRQEEMAPILFTHGTRSDADIQRMHRVGDCFVTATRAEAFHLPAFDAVLAGRKVISTAGLGSDDFLAQTSATFVAGYKQPVQDDVVVKPDPKDPSIGRLVFMGSQGVTARCTWNDPNLVQLANAMRQAALARSRDLEVFYDLPARFGRKAVGELAMSHLSKG